MLLHARISGLKSFRVDNRLAAALADDIGMLGHAVSMAVDGVNNAPVAALSITGVKSVARALCVVAKGLPRTLCDIKTSRTFHIEGEHVGGLSSSSGLDLETLIAHAATHTLHSGDKTEVQLTVASTTRKSLIEHVSAQLFGESNKVVTRAEHVSLPDTLSGDTTLKESSTCEHSWGVGGNKGQYQENQEQRIHFNKDGKEQMQQI